MKIHQVLEAAKAHLYPAGRERFICFACERAVGLTVPADTSRYIGAAIENEAQGYPVYTLGVLYGIQTGCPWEEDDYIAFRDAWLERLIERAKREDV